MVNKKIILQIEKDTAILVLIVAILGAAGAVWQRYRPHFHTISQLSFVPATIPLSLTPLHNNETISWISPDGKKELEMKTVYHRDDTKTATFFVKDILTQKSHMVFPLSVPETTTLQIPFNSWSPDNTYFFIEETNQGATHYLVLRASGDPMQEGQQFLDISELFAKQATGYTFFGVTGWASPTLLILTTKNADHSEGQSYWVDVSSQSVIPLSTQF